MSFSANAVLVRTEKAHAPPRRASFERERDPFDPEGAGYSANTRGTASFVAQTEKKNIAQKRFRPPGDGRFFDHFH